MMMMTIVVIIIIIIREIFYFRMDLMLSALCTVARYNQYERVIICGVQVEAITAKATENSLIAFISFLLWP